MSVIKGRVLEIRDSHVIVLIEDCQYLKIARPQGNLRRGGEIEVILPRVIMPRTLTLAAVISLAAALVLFLVLPNLQALIAPAPAAAYGIIALDINPAIELAFDRDLRVTTVRAVNPEGEYLLRDIKPGMDIYEALNIALEQALQHGYLTEDKENNALMLTLVGGDDTDSLLDYLETDLLNKLKTMNIKGFIFAHQSGWQQRNNALKQDMSLNRLLLREILQTGDLNRSLLDLLIDAVPSSMKPIGSDQQRPNPPGKPNDDNNHHQPGQDHGKPGQNPGRPKDGDNGPGSDRRP